LYMAFVAIASYTQPNYELSYALKFMRMLNLILTQLFSIYGYIAAIIIFVIAIVSNKTVSGKSYVYPLIPFKPKQLCKRLFRYRLPHSEKQ
ncbi:MAG: spore germination protein, partial [Clostridiales bacterium]|nr:spore germination protein [Clostridiales bacterium]